MSSISGRSRRESRHTCSGAAASPRVSLRDLELQLEALLAIRDKISEAHRCIAQLRTTIARLHAMSADMSAAVAASAAALADRLVRIEKKLIVVPGDHHGDTFGRDETAPVQGLTALISVIASADAKPTQQAGEVAADYVRAIDRQLSRLRRLLDVEARELLAGSGHGTRG